MSGSERKLVVLDFDIPQLFNNKIFDPLEAEKVHHTILPACFLFQQARAAGIDFVTQDIFFALPEKPKDALLVSNLVTPYTDKLIAAGVRPVLLTCQESPFIATRFYLQLKKYSARFPHAMVFSGMQGHLFKTTCYHQMFFPESFDVQDYAPLPFSQKKLVCLISSNKRLDNWKKTFLVKFFYGLSVRPIYHVRQDIINFYSKQTGFDLYGRGWEMGGQNGAETTAILKVYKGTIPEKTAVLKNYKFVFCFENAVFPGYVTEKIFDAMHAGSVPIYLGAPDIEQLVPPEAFVDFRKFKNLPELHKFLETMTEVEYEAYSSAIKNYLHSPKYENTFSQKHFISEVLGLLQLKASIYA